MLDIERALSQRLNTVDQRIMSATDKGIEAHRVGILVGYFRTKGLEVYYTVDCDNLGWWRPTPREDTGPPIEGKDWAYIIYQDVMLADAWLHQASSMG